MITVSWYVFFATLRRLARLLHGNRAAGPSLNCLPTSGLRDPIILHSSSEFCVRRGDE